MGHIHIGYPDPSIETNECLIKALDVFLGVPSVLLDTDESRKKLYGRAGNFRPKSFGLEYRPLSCWWLKNYKSIEWVFTNVREAILFFNNGFRIPNEDGKHIQQAMKDNDKELAEEILESYDVPMPNFYLEPA